MIAPPIPIRWEGSTVTMGGAMSAHEIGLVDAVKNGNYHFIDRDAMADKRAAMLAAYDADVFLTSANAITEDGVMVNIDGNANRVSAIAQGRVAASSINILAKKPDDWSKSFIICGIVEFYAILSLLASMLMLLWL